MTAFENNINYLVPVDSSISLLESSRIAARCFLKSIKSPLSHVVKDNQKTASKWAIYFCYNPNGNLLPQNDFMINALKKDGFGVCVVLACSDPGEIDERFTKLSDVVIWKDMPGFDISALKIGLTYVHKTRGEVSAIWINDSIFGPFNKISHFLEKCGDEFDVLGLTLSYAIRPHIQSYCIYFKKLTEAVISGLFGQTIKVTLNDHLSNVLAFEASFAANLISAGFKVKCWAAPVQVHFDLTMAYPFKLVEHGFPFVKRSLVGKFSSDFDRTEVEEFFRRHQFTYSLS